MNSGMRQDSRVCRAGSIPETRVYTDKSNSDPRGSFCPGGRLPVGRADCAGGIRVTGGVCWPGSSERTRCTGLTCAEPAWDTPEEKADIDIGVNMTAIMARPG